MKHIIIWGIVIALCLPIIWGSVTVEPVNKDTVPSRGTKRVVYAPECPFYDAEGNKIPVYAVDLLVRSQFVIMRKSEVDTIRKYFCFSRVHVCPFKRCPMKGQLKFHGCTYCIAGSDCWMLDWVHWEHPSWTYDQCEEMYDSPEMGIRPDSSSLRYILRR